MKYKVGDKVLLMAEIVSINVDADEVFPYDVNIHVGDNEVVDYYACTEGAIISSFNGETAIIPLDENGFCDAFVHDCQLDISLCRATKELDACDCKGNQRKCDFYESVRNKSNDRIFNMQKEDMVTAEEYQSVLQDIQKLAFYEIMAIFGWTDYEAPLNKECCLEAIVKRYAPKEVVDAYEKWKFINTVNVGDVIYLAADKQEYLVTNIVKKNGIVQYHMIAKDFCVSLVGYSNVIEQMPSNAFTKIKSNETIQNYLYGQEE